jgi:citrate synthase
MTVKTELATLQLPANIKAEFPILKPTLGFDVLDVRVLGKQSYYTFDPGFMATAACESKITYIDGEAGVLLYRGYPIEPLAEYAEFSEIIHLVFYGKLPTVEQNNQLKALLAEECTVAPEVGKVLNGFARDAHPMGMLMALVTALQPVYGKTVKIKNPIDREHAALQLIAKIPTLAAMCYRYSINKEFIAPDPKLDYATNFMYMLFGTVPSSTIANAMNRIFVLHADHEQNASTSTVRLVGSTDVNPFAAIVAGIAALWGPAHGGANEACLNMLRTIASVDRIPEFIARAKDKNDGFKLMGFGHRVYKNRDPRATFMKISYEEVLKETGHSDPLLTVATELEKAALADNYFIDRKLFPNVDFYSGITQTALGIPVPMFTVVFALARMTGWVAQWNEMLSDPNYKIGRPRQLYTGYTERDYVALEKR